MFTVQTLTAYLHKHSKQKPLVTIVTVLAKGPIGTFVAFVTNVGMVTRKSLVILLTMATWYQR